MAWAIEVYGAQDSTHPVTGNGTTLGRAPDNDIVVASPVVSRHHARLSASETELRFTQLGSSNPTLRNGVPLVDDELRTGDVLTIGSGDGAIELHVKFAAEANSAEPKLSRSPDRRSAPHQDPVRLTLGRDPASAIVLPSPLASRRHAVFEREGNSAVLLDLGSSNGTFVNGFRVKRAQLNVGDTVQIATYRLRFDGSTLHLQDRGTSVTLQGLGLVQRVKDTTILSNVSLVCLPGEVTAVAGTSGAGKTTLLDALTGIRPAAEGMVTINGTSLYENTESLRTTIGYVPQANILHLELPLERALTYVARLRLPPDTASDEIAMRVSSCMHVLGLVERRNVAIKHLSGGQQKRASIAVELLTEPALLFLDEPTSGLDPGLTVRLMRLLRTLAGSGKTVVLVSHDPDSFNYCDQILFLASGGHAAFVGKAEDALRYFDVSSYAEVYDRLESEGTPESWARKFPSSMEGRALEQRLRVAAPTAQLKRGSTGSFKAPDVSLPHQFRLLSLRYVETLLRDRRNALLLVLQAPIIAMLLALLVSADALLPMSGDPGQKSDAEKVMLLMAVSAIWLGTINACREIVKELSIWKREHLAGVDVVPYIGSKIAPLAAISALQNVMFMFVLGWKVDYPGSGLIVNGTVEISTTLFVASLASVSMGLAISAASATEERAMTLVPLALIPQILFAGIIFPLSGPSALLGALFTARWSIRALGASVGVDGYPDSAAALIGCWLVLLLMAAAYNTLAAWLLMRRTAERGVHG